MSAPATAAAKSSLPPGPAPPPALAGLPCRFIAEPDVDPGLLPGPCDAVREFTPGADLAADAWLAGCGPQPGAPVVFVTRRALRTARCASVFGFASRRARAAVVSLAGLESGGGAQARRRLAAIASHELGHLAGYRHCRTPGCLMRPAESVEDLDSRRLEFCPACRRRRRWPLAALLLALCLAASLSLDAAIERIRNRTQVFSWRLSGTDTVLVLDGEPLLRLRNPAQAQAAAEALNSLYASMTPPPLRLDSSDGELRIAAGGQPVIPMNWVETGGVPPEEFARRWIERLDPLIQGKGTAQQGCPSCHVNRRGEVLDAMARRSRWWR